MLKYVSRFGLQNVLCTLDFCICCKREKIIYYYYYFIAWVSCSRSICFRSKHSLCAYRVYHNVKESKESFSYAKDPIGHLVSSQKNLFESKFVSESFQDQFSLQEIKSAS